MQLGFHCPVDTVPSASELEVLIGISGTFRITPHSNANDATMFGKAANLFTPINSTITASVVLFTPLYKLNRSVTFQAEIVAIHLLTPSFILRSR